MANQENLKPFGCLAENVQREIRSKGGKVRAKKMRERKTIADALRKVLDEPIAKGSRQTKLDAISVKAVKALFDKPTMKSMKMLAEILGEMEHKITASGEGVTIIVKSQEEKDKLDNMGGLGI